MSISMYIPLILQGCALPLQLSFGELSCHLINLLLNQTAPHYHKKDMQSDMATYAHHPRVKKQHLLICWAESSLSCCLLVSSSPIWSTFCSNRLDIHAIIMCKEDTNTAKVIWHACTLNPNNICTSYTAKLCLPSSAVVLWVLPSTR